MRVILISTYHAALASVVLDDRLRVLVEGDKSLLDGFLVVVSTARGLGSLQESLGHGGVGDLEVEDVLARSNCLLELLSLGNLTRITVNQETLGSAQLLDHGLSQEIKNCGKRNQLAGLHDGSQILASLRSRSDLLSEKISGGQMSEAILGNNLVTLSSLATSRSSQHPDDGQTRRCQS